MIPKILIGFAIESVAVIIYGVGYLHGHGEGYGKAYVKGQREAMKEGQRKLTLRVVEGAIRLFVSRLKNASIEADVSYGYGHERWMDVVAVQTIDDIAEDMLEEIYDDNRQRKVN